MSQSYKNNISILEEALNAKKLDKKAHWKTYHQAFRYARLNQAKREEIDVLSSVDSIFFEKWRVPKVRTSIGIPILVISTLIFQIIYFALLSQNLGFIYALVFFFGFSLVNFTLSHVLYHWIFGVVLGIRFKSIFVFKSSFRKARAPFNLLGNLMPTFGIKYEVDSFLNAKKWQRSVMLMSAPPLTWIWFLVNYIFLLPVYPKEGVVLFVIGGLLIIGFMITQILSYAGKGDFWKASRDYQ